MACEIMIDSVFSQQESVLLTAPDIRPIDVNMVVQNVQDVTTFSAHSISELMKFVLPTDTQNKVPFNEKALVNFEVPSLPFQTKRQKAISEILRHDELFASIHCSGKAIGYNGPDGHLWHDMWSSICPSILQREQNLSLYWCDQITYTKEEMVSQLNRCLVQTSESVYIQRFDLSRLETHWLSYITLLTRMFKRLDFLSPLHNSFPIPETFIYCRGFKGQSVVPHCQSVVPHCQSVVPSPDNCVLSCILFMKSLCARTIRIQNRMQWLSLYKNTTHTFSWDQFDYESYWMTVLLVHNTNYHPDSPKYKPDSPNPYCPTSPLLL